MNHTESGSGQWTEWGFESPFAEAAPATEAPESLDSFDTFDTGEFDAGEDLDSGEGFDSGEAFDPFEAPFGFVTGPSFEGEGFPSGLVLTPVAGATGLRQEHWDPHQTGLPLLDTGPAVRAQKVSPNFTVGELVQSGGRSADVARISPALVRLLQAMRDRSGRSIRITSGYRSWARNKQVYAGYGKTVTLSRHCSGQAADIRITGLSGLDIARLAVDVGGPDLGIGIGAGYAHVDVRGVRARWTYLGTDAGRRALAALAAHRSPGGTEPTPQEPVPVPVPVPSMPGGTAAGRLVVRRHPLLAGHTGSPPDLVLGWNAMVDPATIDVVVHLHGFSASRDRMDLLHEILPISGLDLGDPAGQGRSRPTLTVLPRGHYYGGASGKGYSFPNLVGPGALARLIADALSRFGAQTGIQASAGRLILTAHSGGGAALTAILTQSDPDEVYVYDGLYGPATAVSAWATRRISRDAARPERIPPALRVFYRAGSAKHPGTQPHSEAVARALCAAFASPLVPTRLRDRFRVERTSVEHGDIPRRYGRLLLADAGSDVTGTTRADCGGTGSGREGFDQQAYEPEGYEREGFEAEGYEREGFEAEGYEPEGYEPEGYESEGYESPEREEEGYEREGYEPEDYETENYEGEGIEHDQYALAGNVAEVNGEAPPSGELPGYEFEDKPVTTVCGFFAPTVPVVPAAGIRRKVVVAARAEQTLWTTSAPLLRPESSSTMFGHLVRYWLAEQARIPAGNLAVIAARAPNTTYGATLLGSATLPAASVRTAARRTARLLIRSLPQPATPADLEDLVLGAILAARRSKLDQIAWSAAFINSCVRRAGLELNLQGFTGGGEETLLALSPLGRHWEYLLEAHRRRFGCRTSPTTFDEGCRKSGTYHAFRTTERAPVPGDIIVQDRNANTRAAVLAFDGIPGLTGLEMHADIVVDVQPTFAETIGGNVGNTVRRRRYPLDAAGLLVVSELRKYVAQRDNGSFPALPAAAAAPAPAALPSESTARIVALLHPVQECRSVLT